MTQYFGELENQEEEDSFKIFSVMAENPEEAYMKLSRMISENKTGSYTIIYQITKIEDMGLPQPVFDIVNGFEIYK